VARGEARRDSLLRTNLHRDARVVRNTAGEGTPELFAETVAKVYKKKPDMIRTIELRHFEALPDKQKDKPKDKDDDGAIDADFTPGMGEEIVNFAFRPSNRRNYRFTIEGRKLLGDHLLYTLRFEPHSALNGFEPAGRVWVDTKDFVIVRQEIEFRQSPLPLFLKTIKNMVVERSRAGEFWVLSRALIRMELTVPIPKFGRSFDFAMGLSDYTVNTGLPDSLFASGGKHDDATRTKVKLSGGKKSS
jgi:hypothetical protein